MEKLSNFVLGFEILTLDVQLYGGQVTGEHWGESEHRSQKASNAMFPAGVQDDDPRRKPSLFPVQSVPVRIMGKRCVFWLDFVLERIRFHVVLGYCRSDVELDRNIRSAHMPARSRSRYHVQIIIRMSSIIVRLIHRDLCSCFLNRHYTIH